MSKKLSVILSLLLIASLIVPTKVMAESQEFIKNPKTPYATLFISKCEGQQWFMNELEKILNEEQKSINTISSSSDFANIKIIGVMDSEIDGMIPSAIGELTALEGLFLSGNSLHGELPATLYTLPNLKNIDLSGNKYSGNIPNELGMMESLEVLNLSDNDYVGTIPSAILSNTKITHLDVSKNSLSGAIPNEINSMTGLEYLSISDNPWNTGAMIDLSSLTNLKVLSMWKCNLIGNINENLYNMKNLEIIDLASNNLVGEINANLFNLENLKLLSIANNKMSGTVPAELGNFSNLKILDISNNKFRGKMPDTLLKYKEVYAHNNYMTGETLKNLKKYENNFVDGDIDMQYQLTPSKEILHISKDGAVNIYAILQNKNLSINENINQKPLLEADKYIISADNKKVEITYDEKGFYAKALTDIPRSDNFTITICIKDNEGSNYSTGKLELTTDAIENGGGGGGMTQPSANTVVHSNYVNGYMDGKFLPDGYITREETAKMLLVALDEAISAEMHVYFKDVNKDRWPSIYIETAYALGYINGYENGDFKPSNAITRAEMASILTRIAEKEGRVMSDNTRIFEDVSKNKWYSQNIENAVRYGLINGYDDGTFKPDNTITRAEAVVMINRLINRNYTSKSELDDLLCPFTDIDKTHWAYGDIMEASVIHNHETK